ncbi:poly(A) polymerase large subunit [Nile crocodilepox virus]|uniref:Poly(A) polymerase catalytic subunit n=1 Tax=Nile crocodilepox virus (isolate Crocodylus niloticus/Zimbabwe/Ume/2001) TaxID=1289473 RepID=PAP1_CPRVZ|nr:poly(A) polymerase large subunit [Nile crocodilepox virus]Q070J7.1 RecName: Full=Poly(A) polymerase catalytic subunit; AltName: Full=Poly(A) polymerase large subunit; Short=PAP-L [Nile crocodilepox virus Zimbabwe/Ume/2001]ABJ08945.1 poly(A) polymerase large subunit [Nile crocodilepox virus]
MNNRELINRYLGKTADQPIYYALFHKVGKIKQILNFDLNVFLKLLLKNRDRFLRENKQPTAEIKRRLTHYFTKQHRVRKVGKILSIVEFQHVIVTTFTRVLGVLTIDNRRVSKMYSSTAILDYAAHEDYVEAMLRSYRVTDGAGPPKGRNKVSDLVGYVISMLKEYLKRHNKSAFCHGSYSLHLLNPAIEYGDIDMLQTNSRTFLINLAFLIYCNTGRVTTMMKIPYLLNYIVMFDEEQAHIVDSFQVSQEIFDRIPKILINDIYIIDPCVQLLNGIKMFSQVDRLDDLHTKFEKLRARFCTLLEYVLYDYDMRIGEGSGAGALRRSRFAYSERVATVEAGALGEDLSPARWVAFMDNAALDARIGASTRQAADFGPVTNSRFLEEDGCLYGYFSNTLLLTPDGAPHPVSCNALAAHFLMYFVMTGAPCKPQLACLLNSLVVPEAREFTLVPRDKKLGDHVILSIDHDVFIDF